MSADLPGCGNPLGATLSADGDGAEIPALPPGVKLTTLENGLIIIVREDHSAPVVSAQAWCLAGSIHEGKWLGAGMSHRGLTVHGPTLLIFVAVGAEAPKFRPSGPTLVHTRPRDAPTPECRRIP